MSGLDLDLVVSLLVVAGAGGFLFYKLGWPRLFSSKRACCDGGGGGKVVVNDRLARALEAARRRER